MRRAQGPAAEGQQLAVLRDQRANYSEAFTGFSLTKFDGKTVTT